MVGVGFAAAAAVVIGSASLAADAFRDSGSSAREAALAHELRMQRQALDRTRAQLDSSQRRERWLRARYSDQMQMELQALHRIEFDENTDRSDAVRVLNDEAAAAAVALVGTPYTYGGAAPGRGFDASGLVQWAWARQGVALPHNAAAQYALSPHIDGAVDSQGRIHYDRLAIGDLVFFNGLGHVSIYIGNGYMVDAPHTGTSVRILRAEDVRDLRGHADGAARIVA
jgi:cell wall-associated NlpC family hydrolase